MFSAKTHLSSHDGTARRELFGQIKFTLVQVAFPSSISAIPGLAQRNDA